MTTKAGFARDPSRAQDNNRRRALSIRWRSLGSVMLEGRGRSADDR